VVSDVSPAKTSAINRALELVIEITQQRRRTDNRGYYEKISRIRIDPARHAKPHDGLNITLAGYLTDSEVLSLYEEVDVFVYPSLYEGFGLPVLEAMAWGVRSLLERLLITRSGR